MQKETGDRWQQSSVSKVFLCQSINKNIIANLTQEYNGKTVKKAAFFRDFRVFAVLVIDSNNRVKTYR